MSSRITIQSGKIPMETNWFWVLSNRFVLLEIKVRSRLQTSNKLRPYCDKMSNTHLSLSVWNPFASLDWGNEFKTWFQTTTKINQLRLKYSQKIYVLIMVLRKINSLNFKDAYQSLVYINDTFHIHTSIFSD